MSKPQIDRKLTPREKGFVDAYVIKPNATEAAIKSGSPARSAGSRGYELLSKRHIQKAIEQGMAEKAKRNNLAADDVLQELKRLVFFDPRKLFKDDGSPIPIHELDDDTAKAIAGLEVIEQFEQQGNERVFVGYLKKYKLIDKLSAIDKAMRHLSLYRDKIELSGKITLEQLVAGEDEKEKG